MNNNIRTLTSIWCVIIFLGLTGNLYAQTTDDLFKVVNAESVLSVSELSTFTDLDNDKIKEKALIDISGLEQALRSSMLSVPLKGADHSLRNSSFSNTGIESFTFKGSFTEALGEVYLYQTNGYLYGNIHIDSLSYQIEPINKNYAVLLRRDYSEDVCPLGVKHDKKEDSEENHQNDSSKSKSSLMMNDPVIDVMVVFSSEAASATPDLEALAEAAVQSTNSASSNSDAGVSFNLVHYEDLSYNEASSAVTDKDRLVGTSDGYMDNVHTLRSQYGADIVVLIVNDSPFLCGVAATIKAGVNNAFAVVIDHCAVGNYSFAHEIGHLAGARHDDDSDDDPYDYGHGFSYGPAYWRTVMAVDDIFERVPYWSNPNKYYGGVAMGTTNWNDNARVWDERAATVAAFKTPPPALNVTITGPTSVDSGELGSWSANVSSGSPPYSYTWYKTYNMGTPFVVSTGSGYADTDTQSFTLSLHVTDDNSDTGWGYKSVMVIGDCGGGTGICKEAAKNQLPTEFSLSNNYPNPFNPFTQITYALPEVSDVTIQVYNLMGQHVATLINSTMGAGFHEVSFDAGNLSSGLYIAKIDAFGNSGERFTKEIKMQLIKLEPKTGCYSGRFFNHISGLR